MIGLGGTDVTGQDPIYSQFYNAPLQLNPAFTGTTYGSFLSMNYRNQWPSINVYETYSVSYDQFIPRLNSGLGATILSDDAGDGTLRTTRVSGLYSYEIKFRGDHQIKLGIEAGLVQLRLDWDRLIFFDQLDPRFGTMTPGGVTIPTSETRPEGLTKNYIDISSGLLLYTPNYYVGLSLKHLNTPDQSFLGAIQSQDKLPVRFSIHGGYQIELSRNKRALAAFITPNVLYIRQGDFSQLNVGAYTGLRDFFAGLWYRQAGNNGDAIIVSAGFSVGYLKIGYSYDYTVSELTNGTGGSHEIGIAFKFDNIYRKRSKYNDCLSLFR